MRMYIKLLSVEMESILFTFQLSKERKIKRENGRCFMGKLQEEGTSVGAQAWIFERLRKCVMLGVWGQGAVKGESEFESQLPAGY